MAELRMSDQGGRDDLGAFTARVVRLDAAALVRLRGRDGRLDVWAQTPFDALVTRSAAAELVPADLTVSAADLLAALTVARCERIDPGRPADGLWRAALPPRAGWRPLDEVPSAELEALSDRGIALARENPGPGGQPPATLLEQIVLTVTGEGITVGVPMRCLFALSGMGFLDSADAEDRVRISATGAWLRLDARYGAVVRRRHAQLPLLV